MNLVFSMRLSELRRERGVSQKEAAAGLKISQALLSHYEKGIRECGLDFVVRACEYYGVTCDYLLGHSNSRVGLNPSYPVEDLPEDERMCMNTVYRAAAVVLEQMNLEGSEPLQNRSRWFFCLAVYRTLSAAAQAGFAPREWFRIDPQVGGSTANIMMNNIERSLYEGNSLGSRPNAGKQAMCIRTLVQETERYIFNHVERFFPEPPDGDGELVLP